MPQSEKVDDGGPAFPVLTDVRKDGAGFVLVMSDGMSLRAYFAGQAFVSLLAIDKNDAPFAAHAHDAVTAADALIQALKERA